MKSCCFLFILNLSVVISLSFNILEFAKLSGLSSIHMYSMDVGQTTVHTKYLVYLHSFLFVPGMNVLKL